MDYNYHTHTVRCRHATDADEEYVRCAIDGGIKYMGFSDHAPFIFPDGHEANWRVETSRAEEYIESIRALREKYRDKIELKVGFEMEYYPLYFDDMLANVKQLRAEYLILGQHFLFNEHPNGKRTSATNDSPEELASYAKDVCDAIRSGCFSYVAHPDIINFTGDDDAYYREIVKICETSKECLIPLEINFLGIRSGRRYPNDRFWKIAGEVGSPVTFGMDAHESISAADRDSLPKAMDIVKKFKLNYIGKPNIISI